MVIAFILYLEAKTLSGILSKAVGENNLMRGGNEMINKQTFSATNDDYFVVKKHMPKSRTDCTAVNCDILCDEKGQDV